jgi:hypothetical protein
MSSKQVVRRSLLIILIALALIPVHNGIAQTSSGTSPQCSIPPTTINVWLANYL